MEIQYTLGTNSYTHIYPLNSDEKEQIMERQLKLSFPIITSVKLTNNKKKEPIKQIFVGKEIDLKAKSSNFWIDKYNLSLEDITDIYLQGYKKACLLNYKKYDQVIIGVSDSDEIVPDYFALNQKINAWKEKSV